MPTKEHPAGHPVLGCRRCAGVWLGRTTLDSMLAALVRRAAPTGVAEFRRKLPRGLATSKIVYRSCPVCDLRMHRKNFGRVSGVVVDECGRHGTFFDAGELEDVLAFVRSGGLRATERFERDERERERRAASFGPRPRAFPKESNSLEPSPELGQAVFRWAERWLRLVLS